VTATIAFLIGLGGIGADTMHVAPPTGEGDAGAAEAVSPQSPQAGAAQSVSGFVDAEGARIHFLDHRGTGPPLVFLPGLGHNAHLFDDFAPRFTDTHRVVAISRRGHAPSTGSEADFDLDTLIRDILTVLDSLGVESAAFVGHSYGGFEMTRLAGDFPERVDRLIYLDAAHDYVAYLEPVFDRCPPPPSMAAADSASWETVAAFQAAQTRFAWSESVVRSYYTFGADGRVQSGVVDPAFAARLISVEESPRYDRLEAPALAIYHVPAVPWSEPSALHWYPALGDGQQVTTDCLVAVEEFVEGSIRQFSADARQGRVIRIPDGTHYPFLARPEEVERAMRAFLLADGTTAAEAPPSTGDGWPGPTSATADTVQVAPPTGERDADRASILAALGQVRPGGTVQFAPGTYLVGELIPVSMGRLTLLGHPKGTTLRGCDPAGYEEMEHAAARATDAGVARFAASSRCGAFQLTGGHVAILDLTFEYTKLGLVLGCCPEDAAVRPSAGGYRIEGNTFRHSGNGVRPGLLSTDPTVIRGNAFINTFHAVSGGASHIHVVDNDISVPDPAAVPGMGHPSFAIALGAVPPELVEEGADFDASRCEGNVVAGNRIEGHPEAVLLLVSAGTTCRRNVVRDNTIIVRRAPIPASRLYPGIPRITDDSDATIVGVPIMLFGFPAAPGQPPVLEDNLVQGNHVIGAEGVAIELVRASRNRIVDNTVIGVVPRDPFPGNTLGWIPEWAEANGSAIWVSAGSDENEIAGNVFAEIAGHAVVLEGDHNVVEPRSARDAVRDLGQGNRLTGAAAPAGGDSRLRFPPDSAAVMETLERFLLSFGNLEWEAFRGHFHDQATAFHPLPTSPRRNDGRPELEATFHGFFEAVRARTPGPPFLQLDPLDLRVQMLGDVAIATFHLATPDPSVLGRRTVVLRREGDRWLIVHLHASIAPVAN
jgi:non-heme chloroperoxidase